MERRHDLESWAIALCVSVAMAAWTLVAGKDVTWDLLNHQLYLPFSLLSGRFETDLLAAGPQSYQNPIGYVPLYLLVRSGMPAWGVGLLLALSVTAVQAWAMLRIARTVFGSAPDTRDWRLVAIALSFAAPVHLLVIGGTSNDPLCAALTLVALAIVLDPSAGRRTIAVAGMATGLAIAVKPTSLAFALPTAIVALMQVAGRQRSWIRLLEGVLWAVATFAVAGGLWAYWLWTHFGNPAYPLLNQIFESPLAPTGTAVALRFLPHSVWDWLLRPLEIAQFKPFASVEAFVPDLRPAAAIAATLMAAAAVTHRRGLALWGRAQTWRRADVQLAVFMLAAYGLWMAASGNARYALAWFMLAGLVLARAVHCWPGGRRALLGLVVLLGLQLAGYVSAGDRRLDGQPWGDRPYASFEIPSRLQAEPVLHLSLGVQSYAGLAPFLHPAGAFINLRGQMSLPTKGPLADQLRQRLTQWRGRTRFLFAPRFGPGSTRFTAAIEGDNWMLSQRFGLRIDTSDCEMIRILGPGPDAKDDSSRRAAGSRSTFTRRLLSCAAVEDARTDPRFDHDLAQADRVFALLEAACPRVFGPRPMISDANPGAIWRRYMNSDTVIEISKTEGVMVSYHRARDPVFLGTPEQVIANGGRDACTAWNKLLSQ